MPRHVLNIVAPAGARVVVFRGQDAACVTRAVRTAVADGLILPPGPYRYPYAAVIQLLRETSLFQDPAADTADDVMPTREALAGLLWRVLRRDVRVGVPCADMLDPASAKFLADFAAISRMAVAHGHRTAGLVLGTCGALPTCLRIEGADIRDVPGASAPAPVLSRAGERVLSVMRGAPHPVAESSLIIAADIGARATQAAMRELASADLLDVGNRVALGPSAVLVEAAVTPWLDTPEVRLPPARLSIEPEEEQASRIAHQAAASGEHDLALWCLTRARRTSVTCELMLARAAAHCGRPELAHAIAVELTTKDLTPLQIFELGVVHALLVPLGLADAKAAESCLRAAGRRGFAARALPWRVGLLLHGGRAKAAFNLLRRMTRAQLACESSATVLEHEFATTRCLQCLGDASGAARRLRRIAPLCLTPAQRRERARFGMAADPGQFEQEFLSLSAAVLEAATLAQGAPGAVGAAIAPLMRDVEGE
jgi:hypothetical protein